MRKARWLVRSCLAVSGSLLAIGMFAGDVQAYTWLSVSGGVPFPWSTTDRDCMTLPDGYIKNTCAATKLWDVVIPNKGCSAYPISSACNANTHTVTTYSMVGNGATSVSMILYAYNEVGAYYGSSSSATGFANSDSLLINSVTVPLDGTLIEEWTVVQNNKVELIGYTPD
jgi:hypothetical protein